MAKKDMDTREDITREADPSKKEKADHIIEKTGQPQERKGNNKNITQVRNASASGLGTLEKNDE